MTYTFLRNFRGKVSFKYFQMFTKNMFPVKVSATPPPHFQAFLLALPTDFRENFHDNVVKKISVSSLAVQLGQI